MGCNCGKNRRPLGVPAKPQPNPATQATMPSPSVPPPNGAPTTPPPTSGTTQSFTLTTPDRRVQTFGSLLEARAEKVRRGGSITPSVV